MIWIESARALLDMPRILSSTLNLHKNSGFFKLDAVVFGSDDYCADIGEFWNNIVVAFSLIKVHHYFTQFWLQALCCAPLLFPVEHTHVTTSWDEFLGATRTPESTEVLYARQRFVACCKAFQLQAIDSVYIDIKNLDGLRKQCEEGMLIDPITLFRLFVKIEDLHSICVFQTFLLLWYAFFSFLLLLKRLLRFVLLRA